MRPPVAEARERKSIGVTAGLRFKHEPKNKKNQEWYVYENGRLAGSVVFDPDRGGWIPGAGDLRIDPRATRTEAAEALISWRRKRTERRRRNQARKRRTEATRRPEL